MKRGFEAVLADLDKIAAQPLPDALKAIGMTLVMKVGGASGPLYGTLFMALGKALPDRPRRAGVAQAFARGGRGGQGARQVRVQDEDHARRAGARAGCAADEAATICYARLRGGRRVGGRGDSPDAGRARTRVVPGRAQCRSHGSGRALVCSCQTL